VAAVFHDARENVFQLRLAFGFAVPFREHFRRHGDIASEFVGIVPAQKYSLEKSRFALRKFKIARGIVLRDGRACRVVYVGLHGRL
jgi:hypothetical protein